MKIILLKQLWLILVLSFKCSCSKLKWVMAWGFCLLLFFFCTEVYVLVCA